MKLMFNKNTFEGHWFDEENEEIDTNWTEKVPLNTGYVFDENINDWIVPKIVD